MSKQVKLLFLGFILLVVVGILYYPFRKSPDSVYNSKIDYAVSATQLVEAYSENEKAANEKYLDKILLVEGLVVEKEQIQNEKTVVYLEGSFMGNVSCSFSNNEINNNTVIKGHKQKIKGKCSGYIMDVILTKCTVVE